MDIYVGTSGWAYDWNEGASLAWYVEASGLSAVELNMSFYRFPSESAVAAWEEAGSRLRWSVKVNRSVTHRHLFNDNAFEVWKRFRDRLEPMDDLVDFYLFQAPPRMHDAERLLSFARKTDLLERFALEIRNPALLGDDAVCCRLSEEVTLVSVDSPDFQRRIFPREIVYLRMHGRTDWYRHDYSEEELREIRDAICRVDPGRAYIFFNNDHAMLRNARAMSGLITPRVSAA
ncbi:hypothetical protein ABH15_01115 [Methanoculleus taiwanensis]|uniref:DUF72 domain-containing protein n=1 Tax=Methanoculleus taiwanensis TaxID=1550565 RepID=A0A498H3H8_9EURY|nr:DUF72 domain-containing protein [Methanoculleus taiwanensis]RXE56795.1 hypothetical protein ABH15_01115 [Methanoculleus taiwanensis]